MKHILVLFLTLVLASPVLAQVEKKAKVSNHETDKQAEDNATVRENNMQFQALQNAVDNESQKFNTLSNASKSRHETAKNAIGNIR